jgi:hypothetical protein
MRKQIYIARWSRGVWREAQSVAEAEDLSMSDFVALALREELEKRHRAQARAEARAEAAADE